MFCVNTSFEEVLTMSSWTTCQVQFCRAIRPIPSLLHIKSTTQECHLAAQHSSAQCQPFRTPQTCVLQTRVQSGVKHTNKDASRDCCIDAVEGLYKRCVIFTQDQTMLSTLYTKRKHTNAHTRICTLVSTDMPHQAHPDIYTSLALISHTADVWDVPSGHGHRRNGISTIVNTHLHGLVDGRWRLTGPTRRRHVGPAKDTKQGQDRKLHWASQVSQKKQTEQRTGAYKVYRDPQATHCRLQYILHCTSSNGQISGNTTFNPGLSSDVVGCPLPFYLNVHVLHVTSQLCELHTQRSYFRLQAKTLGSRLGDLVVCIKRIRRAEPGVDRAGANPALAHTYACM